MRHGRIAVVVPTIREECFARFIDAWGRPFRHHGVLLIRVNDGDAPTVDVQDFAGGSVRELTAADILGPDLDLLNTRTAAVGNLGLALAARMRAKVAIILHDDVEPERGTIQAHLDALEKRVPISWVSTSPERMRGFPVALWREAPVMVSHGVWSKVPDWDAPTQLIEQQNGITEKECEFYRGPVPKGAFFPFCGMNVACRSEALPYLYFAPAVMLDGASRFDDIWCGLYLKRAMDQNNWAVVSGYASVIHSRASSVWANLRKESGGMEINETLWTDLDSPRGLNADQQRFFDDYARRRMRWEAMIRRLQTEAGNVN